VTLAGPGWMAAAFAVDVATAEVTRARARGASVAAVPQRPGGGVEVRAPVSGVVLRRLRQSEGAVPAGAPLVEIGDARQIEIVADLLSTDAVHG
jgi:HlyD family secretion protein